MSFRTELDELLLAHAAGRLCEAATRLVTLHLELRPESRRRLAFFETLGGLLLERLGPAPLKGELRERVWRRLAEDPAATDTPAAPPVPPLRAPVADLLRACLKADPAPLLDPAPPAPLELPVAIDSDPRVAARLMRLPPACSVPPHGHRGRELTLVLDGRLVDGDRKCEVGDVLFADPATIHAPTACERAGCLCYIVEGREAAFA